MENKIPHWRCAGASVVGRSHEREGLPCQDAWWVSRGQADGCHVVAACVCDGAGSAKQSEAGAADASHFIARWLAQNFEQAISKPADAFYEALMGPKAGLRQLAEGKGESLAYYACTLVSVAVSEDGRWVAWHLGDGGIIARFGQSCQVLSRPKKGDFANVTYFLSSPERWRHVEFYSSHSSLYSGLGPVLGFALFTDGVEMSVFDRKTGAVAIAVEKMLDWHEQAEEDRVSEAVRGSIEDVFKGLTGDDCSIVLLAALGPAGPPALQAIPANRPANCE